jgi:hypothetical protein
MVARAKMRSNAFSSSCQLEQLEKEKEGKGGADLYLSQAKP